MKKIFYSLPIDLSVMFGIIMFFAALCVKFYENKIIASITLLLSFAFLGYIFINRYLSNRGERHCKYVQYWNIWGNKNNVFISMHKDNCEANEGNVIPGKTEKDKFENELKNAQNYLSGAKCSTCTHAFYYKTILSIDPNCEKKVAYRGTLKKVHKLLGMPDNGRKHTFYRVTFKMP